VTPSEPLRPQTFLSRRGHAPAHGRRRMTMTRESGGRSRRKRRGSERGGGHGDAGRSGPRGGSGGLAASGRQTTSGLTCEPLSWGTRGEEAAVAVVVVVVVDINGAHDMSFWASGRPPRVRTSAMVLLWPRWSGLSRRGQRGARWLRPPSSSLSVVSWRATRGRRRRRELIRWRGPGSGSLDQSG